MRVTALVRLVAASALIAAALPTAADAAIYTVNSTGDTGGTCPVSPGACTLRQAITTANSTAGVADTINFSLAVPSTIAPTAALPPITDGVTIDGSSSGAAGVQIDGTSSGGATEGLRFDAGTSTVVGVSVTKFGSAGIDVRTGANVTVQGCLLGLGLNDVAAGNTFDGVYVHSTAGGATIGGTAAGQGNVLSGNGGDGIFVDGSGPTLAVYGNKIGTNAAGTASAGTQPNGVVLQGKNAVVGGPGAGQGNLIAGNTSGGVYIAQAGADGNKIQGNTIGLAANGTTPLDNGSGVFIGTAVTGNQVGGSGAGEGNRIAGNQVNVNVSGDSTVVQGNILGLDANGAAAGGVLGVNVGTDADGTLIGGNTVGARNVLSGNTAGIQTDGPHTKVIGNYIGLAPDGLAAAGNSTSGVIVQQGADNSEIGGPGAGEGNLIAGNGAAGIVIRNSASGVLVRGNSIGINKNGEARRNATAGVRIFDAAGNTIGGPNPEDANTIAFTGGQGINIDRNDPTNPNFEEPVGNQVLRNSIHDTGGLGIDLSATSLFARTVNDPGDGDTGADLQQNFPVLATAYNSGSTTAVSGSLNSTPGGTYKLQFWSNPAGTAEAETYLGTQNVTTDGAGNASFTFTTPAIALGRTVTATASDSAGNTSEISDPATVQNKPPPAVTVDPHKGILGFRTTSFKAKGSYVYFVVTNRVAFDFKVTITGRDGKVSGAKAPAFKSVKTTIKAGKKKTIKLKVSSTQLKAIKKQLKKHSKVTRRPSIRVSNTTTGTSRQYKPRIVVKR